MRISEVFGFGTDNVSDDAWANRRAKRCPFRGSPCTKASKTDPIGICSLSDGTEAAALCPVRFVQNDLIFRDAARLAFGSGATFGIFPEIRILKIESVDTKSDRKVGKVDYLLGHVVAGELVDFAAVEVQSSYFSGTETRSPLDHYMTKGVLDLSNSDRRPDFRSSAQKRLMPQLQLKVPVFRRWGKKFFVVVDTQFFSALPSFRPTTSSNSEVTWLSYPIRKIGNDYELAQANVVYSEWDSVREALREGNPPEKAEIVAELQLKLGQQKNRARTLTA